MKQHFIVFICVSLRGWKICFLRIKFFIYRLSVSFVSFVSFLKFAVMTQRSLTNICRESLTLAFISPHISTPKSRQEVFAVFVLKDELFWRRRPHDLGVKKWGSQGLGCVPAMWPFWILYLLGPLPPNLENGKIDPHDLKDYFQLVISVLRGSHNYNVAYANQVKVTV